MSLRENLIRRVTPYVPGEQPRLADMVKLNTNENPYPPSPKVEEALKALPAAELRRYPDPACTNLVEALAQTYGLSREQVFVGVGSDDVLAMAFMTFFNGKEPVLFPDITYSFYDVWADMLRIPYRTIPLDEDFRIRKEDYMQPNGGIIFPNPNAPTGIELPLSEIEAIVAANPETLVIVDEAYVDFGAVSALPLISTYDNLLVVQTFSKSRSMAGMRIGYAFGCPKLISAISDVKYSFNSYTMNTAALTAGCACLSDPAYFTETKERVIQTREWTKGQLRELGFVFGDSKANFIFAAHPLWPANKLFEDLKEAHIFVRYFNRPRIDNYLRISIGTDEEMKRLIDFLKAYEG